MAECQLRKANGRPDTDCDEAACTFWRFADYLGMAEDGDWSGCAIQHFALLDGGEDVASWLLSAKERIEAMEMPGTTADAAADLEPTGRERKADPAIG